MGTHTATDILLQNTLHAAGQSFLTAAIGLFAVLALAAALLLTLAWASAELASRRTHGSPADAGADREDQEARRSRTTWAVPALQS
jgi:hypothetical protein